jgi:hypothetical protein
MAEDEFLSKVFDLECPHKTRVLVTEEEEPEGGEERP